MPPGLSGWMGFVGIMTLIGGVLNCLSCIGVIQGVLMIVAGVAFLGARTVLVQFADVEASLAPFFQKLKTYTVMVGWTYILIIATVVIIGLLYFTVIMAALGAAASRG